MEMSFFWGILVPGSIFILMFAVTVWLYLYFSRQ